MSTVALTHAARQQTSAMPAIDAPQRETEFERAQPHPSNPARLSALLSTAPRVEIGTANDPLEREADEIAAPPP